MFWLSLRAGYLLRLVSFSGCKMKTNLAGLSLIKEFEGLRLKAYYDPVGVLTIGYGTTERAGIGVDLYDGMVITEEQAEEWLVKEVEKVERQIDNLIKVPVSSDQYSAIVSFAYNVGSGNLAQSTLLKRLNNKDYSGAADEFLRWVYAGGKFLAGLKRRREAERSLFLSDN